MHINTRNRGFTLIELMVALVLGLVVIGGVMGVFMSTYQANAQNIKSMRLTEEMRAIMSLMSRDIRRAGSRQLAWQPSLLGTPNPFSTATGTNWVVSKYGSEAANSCVLFTYDSDANDTVGNIDKFGYRLNAGAVEMRQAGLNCAANGWENITDEKAAKVLALSFTATTEPGVTSVAVRTAVITLSAATNTRAADPSKNAAGAALSQSDCTNIDGRFQI